MRSQNSDRPERGDRMDVIGRLIRAGDDMARELGDAPGIDPMRSAWLQQWDHAKGYAKRVPPQPPGAVDALVDIWRANHNDAARWPAHRAAEALGRLGIDPATYRGRYAAPASDDSQAAKEDQ